MSQQEEEARIAAAVQQQLEKIVTEQQKQFSQMMEMAMKNALQGIEQTNAALIQEREAVAKELDAAKEERAKAEREGEKMAQDFFEGRQKQFTEAAKTAVLRDLVRMHLETGKTTRDIAVWLDLPESFVENIREIMTRNVQYAGDKAKRLRIKGNPTLRYADSGRGGTIWYESPDATFDMWWEFAGGDALVIVDIPTEEFWEKRTKLPLEQRENILTFIGEQIVEDKISGNGSFIIGDNMLTFYA